MPWLVVVSSPQRHSGRRWTSRNAWPRHITAFPVSGVFTFVRNEALTTAGIRGSRVAELIADLAAANQVSDRVVTLMRRGLLQD